MKKIMIRLLMVVICASLLFISCNKKIEVVQKSVVENKVLMVEDLNNDAFEYKNGKVTVDGLCIHVCKHSGKKLFIIGKSENDKLQVYTSESIPAFDMNLTGSKLRVTGTLEEERIDLNKVAEMETELKNESADAKKSCPTEDDMKEVNELRARISKSKKGYISIYTMICSEVKSI